MSDPLTISSFLVPAIIFGGAFFIFLTMIVIASVQWIRVASARRWPVVQGSVLESRVAESRDSHGAWFYRPIITYRYEAVGHTYTNNVIAFGSRSLSEGGANAKKRAHETVARYPVGSLLPVHYHPQRPDQAVLEIRSVLAKGLVLAAFIFLLAGAFAAGVVLIVNVAGSNS
jgi:hypothetical protein